MKKIFKIVFSLGAVAALYFVWSSKIIEKNLNFSDIQQNITNVYKEQVKKEFPALEGQKEAGFQWEYQGKKFDLTLNLYDSVYKFYAESPKEYSYLNNLPQNWEEEYYGMFLKQDPKDQTISELASKIKELAKKNKLSFDEEIELTLSFVQAIPYDEEKARNIEQDTKEEKPNYPYEVLYENKGVCSGKSFLAYSLIRELGYGTTLFEYKDQKHIAVGVECSKQYSTYDSGYCFAETTKLGHKIGIVPDISVGTSAAVSKKIMGNFGLDQENQDNITKLGDVAIFNKLAGKSYELVSETFKIKDRIDFLEKEIATSKGLLNSLKSQIEKNNQDIEAFKNKMNKLIKNKEIQAYNDMVPQYNSVISKYQKEASDYKQKMDTYNKKVAEYNQLIKIFYN